MSPFFQSNILNIEIIILQSYSCFPLIFIESPWSLLSAGDGGMIHQFDYQRILVVASSDEASVDGDEEEPGDMAFLVDKKSSW